MQAMHTVIVGVAILTLSATAMAQGSGKAGASPAKMRRRGTTGRVAE